MNHNRITSKQRKSRELSFHHGTPGANEDRTCPHTTAGRMCAEAQAGLLPPPRYVHDCWENMCGGTGGPAVAASVRTRLLGECVRRHRRACCRRLSNYRADYTGARHRLGRSRDTQYQQMVIRRAKMYWQSPTKSS